MLTSISLKIAALASFVLLASASCNLCKANHEAANRKTRLLHSPGQIKIAAPANAAQSKPNYNPSKKEWANWME